ncbi:glycosyltransferase family A protein [Flavobacteriaceae bacterium 14752]|uniref:glycosyltransferase family A protein n=1 Tax=Mesohalobacter salilacus TaxID=2491711 RepID=UPI000F63C8F9|nr:glycosyltransferase family 2 protein [Flavobacteriaceae bacterium 14752]
MNTKRPKVEFLISTMHRTDLGFLDSIFKNIDFNSIPILIVNQTSKHKNLVSHKSNIRVINSYEKGLSKSRNHALNNAIGEICFIVDDDVEYLPGALNTVLKAYEDYPDAAFISFQFLTKNGKVETLYQKKSGLQNNLLHKQHLHSFEITLKPEVLLESNIQFNTCFGIGALFHSGEEQVLRDDVVRKGHKVFYVNKPIVKHLDIFSVAKEGSKEFTRTITAVKYRLHKNLIYLWLLRYIWQLFKRKVIKLAQTKQIWTYGVKAVSDYKTYCKK